MSYMYPYRGYIAGFVYLKQKILIQTVTVVVLHTSHGVCLA